MKWKMKGWCSMSHSAFSLYSALPCSTPTSVSHKRASLQTIWQTSTRHLSLNGKVQMTSLLFSLYEKGYTTWHSPLCWWFFQLPVMVLQQRKLSLPLGSDTLITFHIFLCSCLVFPAGHGSYAFKINIPHSRLIYSKLTEPDYYELQLYESG